MLKVELHQKCPSNVPVTVRVLFIALGKRKTISCCFLFHKDKVTLVDAKIVTIDSTCSEFL